MPGERGDDRTRFLSLGDAEFPLHVGSVWLFDAVPSIDVVERRIAAQLVTHPFLGRPPARSPLAAALQLEPPPAPGRMRRVERTASSRAGDASAFASILAEVWSRPLPLDLPWHLLLVEGLPGGRAALVAKGHRSLVDECGGLDLLDLLLGPDEVAASDATGHRNDAPSVQASEGSSRRSTVRLPTFAEVAGAARGALDLLQPDVARARALEVARWIEATTRVVASPAPETPVNGAVGRGRRIAWVRLSRDAVLGIEESIGASSEQVVLTIVADGLGRYLAGRGRAVSALELETVVRSSAGSALISLPVGDLPLRDRCTAIRRARRAPAARERWDRLDRVFDACLALPAPLRGAAANLAWQAVNFVCVEARVPKARSIGGLRPVLAVPLAPLPWNVGLGLAWYDGGAGEIVLGITCDTRLVPAPEEVANALRAAAAEAAAAAGVPAIDPERRPSLLATG